MSFYRSTSLSHYKLVFPRQNAWDIMNQLGQRDMVHIVQNDQNMFGTKPFQEQYKICTDSLMKIYQLQSILMYKYNYEPLEDYDKDEFIQFLEQWDQKRKKENINNMIMLSQNHNEVENIWNHYNKLSNQVSEYQKKVIDFRENLAIIRGSQIKFGADFFQDHQKRIQQLGINSNSFQVNYKAGVINKQQQHIFNRTVMRISKGNTLANFIHFSQIFKQLLPEQQNKMVFFILFPGNKGSSMDKKLDKLVYSYSAASKNLLDLKPSKQKYKNYQDTYIQSQTVCKMTQQSLDRFLRQLAFKNIYEPSPILSNAQQQQIISEHKLNKIQYLKLYFLKEKQLYHQLNQFSSHYGFLSGNLFVRTDQSDSLQCSLHKSNLGYAPVQLFQSHQNHKTPTIFNFNAYTIPAYQIVSTYGTPQYKQANPAFFTTITFPFLFGVMFGDIGHGSIVLMFGLYLIFKQKSDNSIIKMFLPYKYLIALMGVFATYCGFIYNDYLSMSLNLFGSCFDIESAIQQQPIKKIEEECVYVFGLDPVWSLSENKLNFQNSLKMKISVIIAVVHMTLGVFIKASNAIYFRKWIDFFFQFVPQALFLILLFGYMDFLIIYKWLKQWQLYDSSAPSIITVMINLLLKMGQTQNCCGGQPLWGQPEQTSQDQIQLLFLVISVICIPLMLFPKPIYQIICNKQHQQQPQDNQMIQEEGEQNDNPKLDNNKNDDDNEHSASQIFVHQLIETIQYVLGCISNTASYLRLWALSLAHSQLSEVFFNKTVESGIASNIMGIPQMFIGFFLFGGITFGVLLCMDTMQCFLHTLRLHWVEFQNKFYKGDGIPWQQYSFYDSIRVGLSKRQKS